MIYYRVLPTHTRSMPLYVTPEQFTQEWRLCWEDPGRDPSLLMEMFKPMLQHWFLLLSSKNYPKGLNYIALCRSLESEMPGTTAQEMILTWIRETEILSSVLEELQLIFLEQLRGMRYYPSNAQPVMAEFVFARDFRYRLKKKILRTHRRAIDVVSQGNSFDEDWMVDNHPDYFLIKNLGLSQWQGYLLLLISKGNTPVDMARLTHIPRETIYYEEKEIWSRLKQTSSSREA